MTLGSVVGTLPKMERPSQKQFWTSGDCQQWKKRFARSAYMERIAAAPLWDIGSQVVYWWTATEVNDEQAYIIVYDGKVWPRPKGASQGNLGFRAVKAPKGQHAN